MKMRTEYRVIWKETWADANRTFKTLEEAIKYANDRKALYYKNVRIEKLEITEIDF